MKSFTRTIVMLTVLSLAMGSFALAENDPPEARKLTISGSVGLSGVTMRGLPGNPVTDENGYYTATVEYGWSGTVTTAKEGYTFKPASRPYSHVMLDRPYGKVTQNQANQDYIPRRAVTAPVLGRAGGRKALVIPATEVKAEDLSAITQDLQVMSHIFDRRFKEPRLVRRLFGMFTDFGDFFGQDSRATEAIYLQGYGALFLMEVNIPLSPPAEGQKEQGEETEERVDPIWQRAQQEIFFPKSVSIAGGPGSGEKYDAEKLEEFKTELIKTLKHATNIRNLKPDEWVILTVIGQGRQPGEAQFYRYNRRNVDSRSKTSTSGQASSGGVAGYGDSGGYVGGGYAGGGYAGGYVSGYGGIGGYGGGMGGYGGASGYGAWMGRYYGEMGLAASTVLTIRAKKSDVDAFASNELDFNEFRQKVQIFTY